jgi:hypothetical protein
MPLLLVEGHCMKDAVWMLLLLELQYLIDIFINIIGGLDLPQSLSLDHAKKKKYYSLTAAANSSMALPAIKASSWLSLISMLTT